MASGVTTRKYGPILRPKQPSNCVWRLESLWLESANRPSLSADTDPQTHRKLAANNQSSTETSSVKRVLTRSIGSVDKMRSAGNELQDAAPTRHVRHGLQDERGAVGWCGN